MNWNGLIMMKVEMNLHEVCSKGTVVAAFNQEKALVAAFSVIVKLRRPSFPTLFDYTSNLE